MGSATLRAIPEDFDVTELPGFEPEGDGEHAYLRVEKRKLNTLDVVERLARLCGVPVRDVGYSGLKDRNAVARQWFSVGLAGRPAPDWGELEEAGRLEVLEASRHPRKLRRGTHRGNRFRIRLRDLRAPRAAAEARLAQLAAAGAPNYFGEQRFGREGATLAQARRWADRGGRISRAKRGLYLSALRGWLFNALLAARVEAGTWAAVEPGDVCILDGSRSFFVCGPGDADIAGRLARADIHPGLPLWGRQGAGLPEALRGALPAECLAARDFLEASRMDLAWRPTRLLPDDFCWRFCDDGDLLLDFTLGAGSYATALLAEFVQYSLESPERGNGCEQR